MDIEMFKICKEEAKQFLQFSKNYNAEVYLMYMYPITVNLIFSCELSLKGLLIYSETEKNIHTHKLKELYNYLPTNMKNEIKTKYEVGGYNLDNLLAEINNQFCEWRYAFEKPVSIPISELICFAEILYDYLEEVN